MSTNLKVTGMTCMHCVGAVKKALEETDGVDTAEVSLDEASAVVTGTANTDTLIAAVKEAGYEAVRLDRGTNKEERTD